MAIKPIQVVITAFDKASNVLGGVAKRTDAVGKSIEGVGKLTNRLGAGSLGLGLAGAHFAGLTQLPGHIMAVEDASARLAFTEGFTAAESDKVAQAVKRMSRETLMAQTDLLGGIDKIGDAGFDLDDTLGMVLPQAAKQAKAFNTTLETTAGIAYSLGSQFKVTAGDMGLGIDMVSELARANIDLDDLATVLPRIGQASAALGMTGTKGLAEFAADIEIVRGELRDSGAAGKSYAKLIETINDPASWDRFKKVGPEGPGVDVRRELAGAAKRGESQLTAYLKMVKRVTDSEDKALREARLKDLFGDQDAAAVRALIDRMDQRAAGRTKFAEAAGVTNSGFEKVQNTISGQLQQFRNTVLSTDFKPLAQGITLVNDALKWLNADAKNAELAVKGIMTAIGGGGALLVVGQLGSALTGAAGGFKLLGAAITAIATPLGLVISAGAAVATMAAFQAKWESEPGGLPTPMSAGIGGGYMPRIKMRPRTPDTPFFEEPRLAFGYQPGAGYTMREPAPTAAAAPAAPYTLSNPEAVRAAAAPATARVDGQVVIRLEGAPPGTKMAAKSSTIDIVPERGRAF